MKIITRDNLSRDYNGGKSERLVAENIQWGEEANVIAKALNDRGGPLSQEFFVVVHDDYPLYVFEGVLMAGKVTDQLIEFIQARSEWGQQLYGQGMNPFDGRDSITDALEEVLDLAQYLMKWKQERDDIITTLQRMTGKEWLFLTPAIIKSQLDGMLAKLSSDTAERHTKRP